MIQRTNTKKGKDKYKGEASPYWDWAWEHKRSDRGGELIEHPLANPDGLSTETEQEQQARLEAMKERYDAVVSRLDKLDKIETKVLDCLWRQEMSIRATAEWCKLTKSELETHLKHIREKLSM